MWVAGAGHWVVGARKGPEFAETFPASLAERYDFRWNLGATCGVQKQDKARCIICGDPWEETNVSLSEKLHVASMAVERLADPWLAPLQRVRGKVEFDGLERVSSQTLLDMLEVAQRSRTAGTYRRLAKLMAGLGWTAVRIRDLTRGGYKEQVRGYVRNARRSQEVCT